MTSAERPTGLYRSRDGMILGVCEGIADYLDFSLFWTRMFAVLFLYLFRLLACRWSLSACRSGHETEACRTVESMGEREFYDAYVNSRGLALHRLKRTFDNLDRRIRRMEDVVTNREYDWEQRLHKS